jgi:DNA-binding CsgD family transcriptional regulator
MDGAGADAIARDVGVGIETVRTHIRRIYNKLGIGSREELFARLSPFRLR